MTSSIHPDTSGNIAPASVRGDGTTEKSEQAGVKKAMLLQQYMTKRSLMVAYSAYRVLEARLLLRARLHFNLRLTNLHRLFLTLLANRFSVYMALTLNAYATSSFSEHSLLSAAGVVHDITQLCAYPIVAKLEDVSTSTFNDTLPTLISSRLLVEQRASRCLSYSWLWPISCMRLVQILRFTS